MSENSGMSRDDIHRRIAERKAQDEPIGRLVAELRARNNASHAHMSNAEIYEQINARSSQGQPTGQLRRVLRDRGEDIDWQSGP